MLARNFLTKAQKQLVSSPDEAQRNPGCSSTWRESVYGLNRTRKQQAFNMRGFIEIQDAIVFDVPKLTQELRRLSSHYTDQYMRELSRAIARDAVNRFPDFEETQLYRLANFLRQLQEATA